MARLLGMQRSLLPFRYLGINLFTGRNRPLYYQHLLEKIDGRLLGWQRKLLSPGGRLTLIKHVLSTIPLFTAASIMLPRQTERALEAKFANFFWGTANGQQKRHWAAWPKICFPKEEGGLGIRSLATIQKAFSAKLQFHFLQGNSLWSEFLCASYPDDRAYRTPSITWRRMQQQHDFVFENVVFNPPGAPIWKPSTYGDFTFSTAYDLLRPKQGHRMSSTCIWGGGLPSKVSIFMWRLLRRLLPYPDIIQTFGFCLPSMCPFCRDAAATLEHCLLDCYRARVVWNHFGGIFGFQSARATSIRAQCHTWWLLAPSGSATEAFSRMVPCLILWYLWRAYNECLYDGTTFSSAGAIINVKRELYLISLAHPPRGTNSQAAALLSAGLVVRLAEPRRSTTLWVKWLAPPTGRLKLNTDAALTESGAAGGACLRNSLGQLLIGLCFRFDATSALEAEAQALHLAVRWCEAFARKPLEIEIDSLALVTLVSFGSSRLPWKINAAILYIRSCLESWGSSITHVYREANRVADALALIGLNHNSSQIFYSMESLPVNAKMALLYDLKGFASRRAVRCQ